MKKEIHPEYRTVLFHDVSVDKYYLIPSTLETDQTKEWEDGNTYPYCPLDVSSASHPFYTGQNKIIDTGGRVERFKKRFSKKAAVKAAPVEESPKEETPPVEEKEEDVKASAPAEEVTKRLLKPQLKKPLKPLKWLLLMLLKRKLLLKKPVMNLLILQKKNKFSYLIF